MWSLMRRGVEARERDTATAPRPERALCVGGDGGSYRIGPLRRRNVHEWLTLVLKTGDRVRVRGGKHILVYIGQQCGSTRGVRARSHVS